MKKVILLIPFFLLFFPVFIYSQDDPFNSDRFNIFLSPRLLEDGYIIDLGFEILYNNRFSGGFRFRNTFISKTEELQNVEDSLNAINESNREFFLFPIKYYFFNKPQVKMQAGIGINYQHSNLKEKGYFNMPVLEQLNPPKERVNSYTNDFSLHLIGPLVDFNIMYNSNLINITLSSGIVPVFFLTSSQTMSMIPLLEPHHISNKQNTWGGPYMYISLDSILFKYLNIIFIYDFFLVDYKEIDFDDNLNWITPEKIINTHSFKIETSILIPISDEMRFQIGYGFALNTRSVNNNPSVTENKHSFILTIRKSR